MKIDRTIILLFAIVVCSFLYRVWLIFLQTFPPGADIGLHNSIIHSITQSGNTNFLWDFYHMGGGSSDTFPGYHIFAAAIILWTGLPDYVAQGLIVSVFSSLIVAVAFLLTKKIWNTSAALVVAFLVAVSRYDIEMLMWSGYPNVITLMLIPLAFFLFLERERFSKLPFMVAASLVCAAIFLTHSLSAIVFLLIIGATAAVLLLFPKHLGEKRTTAIHWLAPLVVGALIISPFLLQVAPSYLNMDAAVFTGGFSDIQQAILASRLLPFDIILTLFAGVFLYFVFSKHYRGKFVSLPIALLVLWWLIPTFLTQIYLVGLYTDYVRFLYFILLPVIILVGLAIYHCAKFFGKGLAWFFSTAKESLEFQRIKSKTFWRIMPHLSKKNIAAALMVVFALIAFFNVPIFVPPQTAASINNYYQVANPSKYEAIQWAKQNTPADAVFLADSQYGWWFSGFAQRSTISGVDPQYLSSSREFEPALLTSRLIDTDYLVDNGLIQIRQDGGYINRHNPQILAKINGSYYPYTFFNFNCSDTTITLRNNGKVEVVCLSDMTVEDMHMENTTDFASIYVTWGNELFNFTQRTSVYQGSRFVNMDESLQANSAAVSFDTVNLIVSTNGVWASRNSSDVTLLDPYASVAGQLIFVGQAPMISQPSSLKMIGLDILYNLNATSNAELDFYAGAFQYPSNLGSAAYPTTGLFQLLDNYSRDYQAKVSDLPIDAFSYKEAIASLNASYVVICDSEQIPRFAKDPLFESVFANTQVNIFHVKP